MVEELFIWPEPRRGIRAKEIIKSLIISDSSLEEKIEDYMCERFRGANAVLLSSGRSALNYILEYLKVTRNDVTAVFPYASQCVLGVLSHHGSIAQNSGGKINSNGRIINLLYNQWGYKGHPKIESKILIEDSVDSLYQLGSKILRSNGKFEIWSLPKILGTSSGSILWCKNEETAKEIKTIRNQRKKAVVQWFLREVSYKYPSIYPFWNMMERKSGAITTSQCEEIWSALKKWDQLIEDRESKINLFLKYEYNYPRFKNECYGPVIPILLDKNNENIDISKLGLATGRRKFFGITEETKDDIFESLPIPIHQGVTIERIKSILDQLGEMWKD